MKKDRCCAGACGMFRVSVSRGTRRDPFSTYAWGQLFRFVTVKVLKRFELLDERFVLILQHGHSVFQTFNILFLFPAALPCCLPVVETHYYSQAVIEDTKLVTHTKNAIFKTIKLRLKGGPQYTGCIHSKSQVTGKKNIYKQSWHKKIIWHFNQACDQLRKKKEKPVFFSFIQYDYNKIIANNNNNNNFYYYSKKNIFILLLLKLHKTKSNMKYITTTKNYFTT